MINTSQYISINDYGLNISELFLRISADPLLPDKFKEDIQKSLSEALAACTKVCDDYFKYLEYLENLEEEADDNVLTYKGFHGKVRFSSTDDLLHGKILGIKDLVNYEGSSIPELRIKFRAAVDNYLESLKELG